MAMGDDNNDDGDDEDQAPTSMEFIEDEYYPTLSEGATPSLDDGCELEDLQDGLDWPLETEYYLRSLTMDQLLSVPDDDIEHILIDPIHDDDMQRVEAEFLPRTEPESSSHLRNLTRIRRIRFLTKKAMRDIKVTFIDFSKPYLVKISSNDNYKSFLNISNGSHIQGNCWAIIHDYY